MDLCGTGGLAGARGEAAGATLNLSFSVRLL
jgi:hypothetical protein